MKAFYTPLPSRLSSPAILALFVLMKAMVERESGSMSCYRCAGPHEDLGLILLNSLLPDVFIPNLGMITDVISQHPYAFR